MWEDTLPPPSEPLRQGDLLDGIPFPRRGMVQLSEENLVGPCRPSRQAVVLDQCCTVQQKFTVLLATVGGTAPLEPDHQLLAGLKVTRPEFGEKWAKYDHLLAPHPKLQGKPNVYFTIRLLERVSLSGKTPAHMQYLQDARIARMTPLGRAHLRMKLMAHFAEPEQEDWNWLKGNGYDQWGHPIDGQK